MKWNETVLIAYGASMIFKDRLLDESDKSEIYVCERCGLVAYHDVKQRKYVCRVCGDKASFISISCICLQTIITRNAKS